MSEFVALPTISGLLAGFQGLDRLVFTAVSSRTIESFQIGLLDSGALADVVVELRTAGGAESMELTIPVGSLTPTAGPTGTVPIQLAPDDTLDMRIISAPSPAMGLYGTIQLNTLQSGVANTGPDQDLTTDSLVLEYDTRMSAIASTTRDAVRLGVSQRMVRWMGRRNVHPVNVGKVEYHLLPGNDSRLVLNDWDIANLALKWNGQDVDAGDYRVEGDRVVRALSGGQPAKWAPGDYEATYDAGYATVPPALSHAATVQTVRELLDSHMQLIGLTQRDSQTGPVETYEQDGFLRSTVQAMQPFRAYL